MGTDIHGWVEGKYSFSVGDDTRWEEDEWFAILPTAQILVRDYNAFRRLFGVRLEDADERAERITPIAAGRGLPSDMSDTVRSETTPTSDNDDPPHLDGTIYCHSATWLGWSEIQALNWLEFGEDYQILFRLMEVLATWKDITALRLVVWFDN